MSSFLFVAFFTFVLFLIGVPALLGFARMFGIYTVVEERRCHVYVLFGKVVATLNEPGLHFLLGSLGWKALIMRWLGRHSMSQTVRAEVSPKSHEWGYKLGSVYIRKVHFRDAEMIRQIESKVVNRLRQVTAAIKQDGANRVSIIASTAEREAAVEFAKAAAIRPQIVGAALQKISQDPEVAAALFEILETQRILEGQGRITLLPSGSQMLAELLAAGPGDRPKRPATPA